jgi:hypothetical protein
MRTPGLQLSVAASLVVLMGGCRNSATPACVDPPSVASPDDRRAGPVTACSPDVIGAEFRDLRSQRHRVDASSWNRDLDSWGGRMHVVMNQLRACVGVPGTSRADVIASMGEPDQIAHSDSELWWYAKWEHRDNTSAEASELLIYHWRGLHDFLYFPVRDDRVVRADWWMAGE